MVVEDYSVAVGRVNLAAAFVSLRCCGFGFSQVEAVHAFLEEGIDDFGLSLADFRGGDYYYFHFLGGELNEE